MGTIDLSALALGATEAAAAPWVWLFAALVGAVPLLRGMRLLTCAFLALAAYGWDAITEALDVRPSESVALPWEFLTGAFFVAVSISVIATLVASRLRRKPPAGEIDIGTPAAALRAAKQASYFAPGYYALLFSICILVYFAPGSHLHGNVAALVASLAVAFLATRLIFYGTHTLRFSVVLLGFAMTTLMFAVFFHRLIEPTARGPQEVSWTNPQLLVACALLNALIGAPYVISAFWANLRAAQLSSAGRRIARPLAFDSAPRALAQVFGFPLGVKRSVPLTIASQITFVLSSILANAAIGFLWVPPFLAKMQRSTSHAETLLTTTLLWIAAAAVCALAALAIGLAARHFAQRSFAKAAVSDTRPPILLLHDAGAGALTLPRSRLARLLTLGFGRRRLDHMLTEHFNRHGPLITLDQSDATVRPTAESAAYIIAVTDSAAAVENPKLLTLCAPDAFDLTGASPAPKRGAFAQFQDAQGATTLRAGKNRTPEHYQVALQAFFRRR